MQPINIDPGGLDAFALRCGGHSENVAAQTGSQPNRPPADQLTGVVIQALYALITGHGAAMSRELDANGQGASLAGQSFSEHEAGSAVKLSDVLGPSMSVGGQALSAGGSLAGQLVSSAMQGVNTAVQSISKSSSSYNPVEHGGRHREVETETE